MNSESITQGLQSKYLHALVKALRSGTIEYEDAKQSAKEFLALQPFENIQDARSKIQSYTESYPAFSSLSLHLDSMVEEEKVQGVVNKMQELIKDDKVDEALEVAESAEE